MKDFTKFYVRFFMFLFPVIFLPLSIDAFGVGKNVMIMGLSLLGLVFWVAEMLISKKDGIKVSRGLWLMLILTIWSWVGWYRLSPGVQMKSLVDISGVGIITSLLIWYFLWLQVEDEEEKIKQLNWLTAAGILVAVTSIVIFLIPNSKFPINLPKQNPLLSINAVWSLTGYLFSEVMLMLFLAVEWAKRLVNKLKNGEYVVEGIVTSFFSLTLFLDIFKIIKNGWLNLDSGVAWVIAVETLKRSPIWGIGAGNFVQAFNMYRGDSYNLTSNWGNVFLHSNSGILNLWTELGLVGMFILILGVMGLFKQKKNIDFGLLLTFAIVGLFFPVNMVGMMLLLWLVVNVGSKSSKARLVVKFGETGINIAPWILGFVFVGFSIFGYVTLYRVLMADIYMRQSLVMAAKNDGGSMYNLQIKSVSLNPNMADYRRVYSQTNLALASTLLADKEISEENKQKASTLIQQSVREAKAAIALDEKNPDYWINLAVIYRQLVGIVDGSADWSYQAYQQAVAVDPFNPSSKLELGGLLFASNRFEEADRVFEQVVVSKPNFANGWYNWAYSAKKLNKLDYAVSRLTQALTFVSPDSGDYEKASEELSSWKKELNDANAKAKAASAQGSGEPKQAETLKAPEQIVVPTVTKLGGQSELAPTITEVTPTPTN